MLHKTLLAAAIAGLAVHAQAANVVVNFNSDSFDAGSLFGQALKGKFSFDDAALSASTEWLPLTSFSFQLGGQTYTLDVGTLGAAATFTNGQVTGVEAVAPGVGAHDFAFFTSFGTPSVLYANSDGSDVGFATLTLTAAVPEPESYALMLAGLGLVGWLARRSKIA